MQCKSMDCSHNTCTVNKKYYSERKMEEDTTVRRALAAPPLSKTTFNDVRSNISNLEAGICITPSIAERRLRP